jgi:hypothetical protein
MPGEENLVEIGRHISGSGHLLDRGLSFGDAELAARKGGQFMP